MQASLELQRALVAAERDLAGAADAERTALRALDQAEAERERLRTFSRTIRANIDSRIPARRQLQRHRGPVAVRRRDFQPPTQLPRQPPAQRKS